GSSTMTTVLPQDSEQDEDTTNLWNIHFRRQQLQNRLQFLQEIQKKNNRIEEYLANEEGPSELDRIEEELKSNPSANSRTLHSPSVFYRNNFSCLWSARGKHRNCISYHCSERGKHRCFAFPETTLSLDDVSMSPAKVKCPACLEIVTTETHYKLGSNAFIFCCLLSVV
ncbi:hypothetical protein cypCar_00022180, partial [Cyprinus carpio]